MRIAWILTLLPVLAACSDQGPEDTRLEDLEAHEALWDSGGPDSYVYAVQQSCFCPNFGSVRIRVEDGGVVERVFVDTGDPVPVELADAYPNVDGLFDILRSAIESEAFRLVVTYDPTLGVPIEFFIDYEEMTADEELGMQVTEEVSPIP